MTTTHLAVQSVHLAVTVAAGGQWLKPAYAMACGVVLSHPDRMAHAIKNEYGAPVVTCARCLAAWDSALEKVGEEGVWSELRAGALFT